jgi:hypothetical protein
MTKFPYKRIVSYGCSITAGSELGTASVYGMTDDQLKEFVKVNQIDNIQKLHYIVDFANARENYLKIEKLDATLSWPNYIAAHFNVPLDNRAIGGSSLSSATHNILKDLHNSDINNDDLVLVGITGPFRWFQYDEDGGTSGGVVGTPHWKKTPLEYQTQLQKHYFNRYNLLYAHFKEIAFISNLSDTLNGRIKLCYAMHGIETLKLIFHNDLKEKDFAEFFDFCINMCPSHNFIEKTVVLDILQIRPSERHPFGHPKVKYHKEFADILITKLEAMYSD